MKCLGFAIFSPKITKSQTDEEFKVGPIIKLWVTFQFLVSELLYLADSAESNAIFLFYINQHNFLLTNNTTQLTELREKILNCNPNSNICSPEFLFL